MSNGSLGCFTQISESDGTNGVGRRKKRILYAVDEDKKLFESDDRSHITKDMDTFFSKKGKVQCTLNKMFKKDDRDKVCQQIARFFYTSALSFNCVKNP